MLGDMLHKQLSWWNCESLSGTIVAGPQVSLVMLNKAIGLVFTDTNWDDESVNPVIESVINKVIV